MAQIKKENRMIEVDDNRDDGSVLLTCNLPDKNIKWLKDGQEVNIRNVSGNKWNLGSSTKDPQGIYSCKGATESSESLHVYFRMCQNCIELNAATVSGFVFTEIISIFFLAVGVYFIAGQDGVRQSRGKNKNISR